MRIFMGAFLAFFAYQLIGAQKLKGQIGKK
jgi:hypothetical protein